MLTAAVVMAAFLSPSDETLEEAIAGSIDSAFREFGGELAG